MTTYVQLTADTPGKAFTVTTSVTTVGLWGASISTTTQGTPAAVVEVQRITRTGGLGQLTLAFNGSGYSTGTAADATVGLTSAEIQTLLEGLSTIAPGDVTVTGSAGGPWTVTFGGTLTGNQPAITSVDATIETLTAGTAGAASEVQVLTITGSPTGGTFTLTFAGQTTGNIAYNASAATVVAALEALSNIGAGNVTGGGGALPGTPVTLTFASGLASLNVPELTVDGANLTGVSSVSASVTLGTANSSPNDWALAANWSSSGVPANGDTVIFEGDKPDCNTGLDQSAVTLAALIIRKSYTGKIGLPAVSRGASGSDYYEYRDTYLKVGATLLTVGEGEGAGSGRIKIALGSVASTINVYGTGQSAELNVPALLITGTHASNILNVFSGSVGLAFLAGETSTVPAITVGYTASQTSDAAVRLGSGCTLTTVSQSGGSIELASNVTTYTQLGGDSIIGGSATVTTLNLRGGSCKYRSSGTLTTANVSDSGILDFSSNQRTRTVTTINVYAGASLLDPFKTVTFTNGIDLEQTGLKATTIDIGQHVKLTLGAPT